jgi:hypothetical protein
MTTERIELLREAIASEQLGYTEVMNSMTAAARCLAGAIAEGDLDSCELHARYIADVSRWLAGQDAA